MKWINSSVQFSSVPQLCQTLCDPMNRSMPGFHHQLPEFTQTHVHRVSDAIQPSHPLSLRQVLSTYDGDIRDPLWWPQERPVPMRVARGPLGIPLPSMRGLRPFVESVPEPEDSSPVLTWILGSTGVSPGESVLLSSGGMHVRFPSEL